jgi:hypothetical protein
MDMGPAYAKSVRADGHAPAATICPVADHRHPDDRAKGACGFAHASAFRAP